ncbi:MAG: glycosyltransferase family 4 protein [SAR324 cluster bacterium]|nr:glycosyltransferase family 4 protein [SAR324 cluster bacterium]
MTEGPLHILQMNGRADLSGGPVYMVRLIRHLPQHWRHTVMCPSVTTGILPELKTCPNVRLVLKNLRYLSILQLIQLLVWVRREKFDLIHSHGKAAGIYARIIGRLTGIPVIHHFHGIHYRQYSSWLQWLYLKLEKKLTQWSAKVICVSESEHQEALALRLFQAHHAVVIKNGVNPEQFVHKTAQSLELRQRLAIPEQARILLSVTRMCYQKNVELMLKIHERLCTVYPSLYLLLLGVAADDPAFRQSAGSSSVVHQIIPLIQIQDVSPYLNLAEVYLNTSRWEGMSLGLIEAMATGLPVVLSDVVGNRDVLRKIRQPGFLIPEENIDEYVRQITYLLDHPQAASQIGQSLRQLILQEYTIQQNADAIAQLYTDISAGGWDCA